MKPSELPDLTGEWVACDTETSGLHPDSGARVAAVSVAWFDGERVVSYAWPFDQGARDKTAQGVLDFDGDVNLPEEEWVALLAWLQRQRLVMHNSKFDLHMLRTGTRHWPGVDLEDATSWDTMLVAKELEPLEPVGLKPTAERWKLLDGGERDIEAELKTYLRKSKLPKGRFDLVPWEIVGPYAAMDAELTIRLWAKQLECIDQGWAPMERVRFRMDVCKVLYRQERRGIGFDCLAAGEAALLLQQRADEAAKSLPFSPPTLPAAKRYFFGEKSVLPYKTTDKGSPQLDNEVLRKMVADGIAGAAEYAEYGGLQRALSMWYEAYPRMCGTDGRLRTTYRQTKVVSGRMSVERVQLQAIPRDSKALEGVPSIRSMFRAKDGYELWNLDLSQAELRVAAKYAKCETMIRMLEDDDADLHGVTTKQVFGISEEHPEWKVKRDLGKRLTFGSIFQIGGKTYRATLSKQAGIDIDQDEADRRVQAWRQVYPEFGRAYRRAERVVQQRGYVRLMPNTPYEERSWFTPLDWPHTGWSRIVQGSLALFNQVWLLETERLLEKLGVDEALLLNVHDSQVLELPKGEAAEIAREVAEHGAEVATELFQITMRTDYGLWHK